MSQVKISRYCGLVLLREYHRLPQVLLLSSRGKWKIGGGMEEEVDLDPFHGMIRESEEEFGIIPTNAEEVAYTIDPHNDTNHRAFWAATEYTGILRTTEKLIEGEMIPAPEWIEVIPELLEDQRGKNLVAYSHITALRKAVLWGARKLEAFHYFARDNRIAA